MYVQFFWPHRLVRFFALSSNSVVLNLSPQVHTTGHVFRTFFILYSCLKIDTNGLVLELCHLREIPKTWPVEDTR